MISEVPATCEKDGTLAHFHCSACGKDFDANKKELTSLVIASSGHTYGDWNAKVDATCEKNGTLGHFHCSVCEKNFDAEKKELTSLVIVSSGHAYGTLVPANDATCEEDGNIAHYQCSACQSYFDANKAPVQTIVIAAGHNYGDLIAANDATCEKTGNIAYYQCSGCGKKFNENKVLVDTVEIPKKDHTGYATDYKCDTCQTVIPPKADSVLTLEQAITLGKLYTSDNPTENKYYVTGVITDVYQTWYGNMHITDGTNTFTIYGTLNEDGSLEYNELEVKPGVGDEITVYGVIGQFKGTAQMQDGWIKEHTACEHTLEVTDHKDATCTVPGHTTKVCTKCELYTETENFDALGHNYSYGECTRCHEEFKVADAEANISFADVANRTELDASKQVWIQNNITVTNNKADSSNNVADYAKPARFYQNSQLIVEYVGKMTKIVFDCNSASYATALVNSIGKVDGVTVTPNEDKVTVEFANAVNSFDIAKLTAQVRMDSITVYAEDTHEHTPDEATCKNDQRCTVCGAKLADALSHTEKTVNGTPATCTQNGLTDGKICSVCDKVLVKQETILAGHKYGELIPATEAIHNQTTLAPSVAAHYYCSACKTYFDESKVETTLAALTGEAPTHSFGDWINIDGEKHWKECSCGLKSEEAAHDYTNACDADCNECGATRTPADHVYDNNCDTTCNVCNYIREITHQYGNLVAQKDATCSAEGMKAHFFCDVCDTYFTEEKVATTKDALTIAIDEDAHAFGDWNSNGDNTHTRVCANDATHTETEDCSGGEEATCTQKSVCTDCNTAYGQLKAHAFNHVDEVPAVHTQSELLAGMKAHYRCTECDGYFDTEKNPTEQQTLIIPAPTHNYVDYKCSVCGKIEENHTHSYDNACDATCNDCGTEREVGDHVYDNACDVDCNVCGATRTPSAHVYDNACDTTCNVCEAERTITHDYELQKNETHHWYACSVCGNEKADSKVAHIGGNSNCQTKSECATCGQTYGDYGDHDYGDWIDEAPATCTENGTKGHYQCSVCEKNFDSGKNELDSLVIDALGHRYSKKIETADYLKAEGANCQTKHTYYYACEHCDRSSKDDTNDTFEGAATGNHIMSESWTIEDDKHFHKCTVDGCNHVEDEANHTYGELNAKVDSTCSKAGMEAHFFCDVCDTYFTEEKVATTKENLTIAIDEDKHSFINNWESNGDGTHTRSCQYNAEHKENGNCSGGEEATCTQKSICSTCEQAYGDFGEHDYGDWIDEDPATCTENGTKGHYQCSVCEKNFDAEYELLENIEIPGGHTWVDNKCSVCKATKITVNTTIATIADQNSWVDGNNGGTANVSFTMGSSIIVSATGNANTGKYYESDESWRIYQNGGGKVTITALQNATIESVTLSFSVSGSGILTLDANTQITSGKAISVCTNYVTFNVGDTHTTEDKGQIRITAIEVVYIMPPCKHANTTEIGATEPTCTEPGHAAGTKCVDCGEFLEGGQKIEATGHNYVDYVCKVCGVDDPEHYFEMSISDAIAAADGKNVVITGTVTSINTAWSDEYGNISVTITDDNGKSLDIFRLATLVEKNDVITVTGTMSTYNEARQIAEGATATINGTHICSTFTDATCTEAAKCKVCGKANGEPLGHTTDNGECERCGNVIGGETPDTPTSNRYYIATIRTSGNYFYMTSDLGTASTKRYTAVDSGLTTLPATISSPENGYVFVLIDNGDGTYSIQAEGVEGDNYLGWTSGNSGTLVAQANAIKFTLAVNDGIYNIHFAASDAERYLALNGTSGNNYFAWYKSGQKQDLVLIPVVENGESGGETPACEHTNTTETTTATCTAAGTTTVTCKDCGETVSTTEIPVADHNYVDGTCSECGAVESTTPTSVEATISFASTANRVSQNTSKQVWKNGDVTFTNNKASSSTNVANYSNPVRLYQNSSITIEAGGTITKIVFDCNSSAYATALKDSIGVVSTAGVAVENDKVTIEFIDENSSFTINSLTAQIRMDSITVTYTPAN